MDANLILIILILGILSFVINITFYIYKMRGYPLIKIKYFIYALFVVSIFAFSLGLPFFIFSDPKQILDSFENYLLLIILFNVSIVLLGSSIVLYIMAFLESEETITQLVNPSRLSSKKGNIEIGRILNGSLKRNKFFLSIDDLAKHMFICGTTGTGKSNFLQNFLINFTKQYKIPFFLVEFKGEYHFLQKRIHDVLILWPGKNFSINIFNPVNSNPLIHAERIFDILKSGQFLDDKSEFSPQMERVLVEILISVCEDKNFQNWSGFEKKCKEYLNKNQKNIPMLKQTIISIKNRIRRFSTGPLKVLFDSEKNFDVNELFNRNIILDLSSIIRLGGEKEDALFFLNMILKYLWDLNLTRGAYNYQGINHLTIIEDAQYFAPQDLMNKNKLTTYLEDIALLQRGTGECLITLATRPDISREILANNGVVVTFKNHLEKDIMCELLNLELENKNYLSILELGQCIIRTNSIKEPFLLLVPFIRRESIKVSEITIRNNNLLRGNFLSSNSKTKKVSTKFEKSKKLAFRALKNLNFSIKNLKKKNIMNSNKDSNIKDGLKSLKKNICDKSQEGFNHQNLTIKYITKKYRELENLHKTKSFDLLIRECKKTIENILKQISLRFGLDYDGIENFLANLIKMNPGKKFILYNEINQFNNALDDLDLNRNQFTLEKSEKIFLLTQNILKILMLKHQKRKNEKNTSGFKEYVISSPKKDLLSQSNDILSKKIVNINQLPTCNTEKKDLEDLKFYVKELINSREKRN